MRMVDIIEKKRDGGKLTKEEIEFFVNGYVRGDIPDYQASALLMAIYFRHMDYDETLNLTLAMENSGDKLDLSGINGIKVDKHSTGGVGDKTSLVLAPMVAALGGKVAKMSGRGLGHTGGTIDKLESIPGFNTSLSEEAFVKQVNDIGIAITGQTGNLAPADKKIYALRDVTATVENISLIASSIMSKKLASGADAIVLDVKTGSGAFMKNEADAVSLAKEMVRIGKGAGRNVTALITDMDQPLGYAVGNALEVIEAINTLKGEGPEDLTKLVLNLGTYMVLAARNDLDKETARKELERVISDGSALDKMAEFVKAQGGDPDAVYNTDKLKISDTITEVCADSDGYIQSIQSELIGKSSMILGGGRTAKDDVIDLSVGVVLSKKIGDKVSKGDVIARIYCDYEEYQNQRVKVTYTEKRKYREENIVGRYGQVIKTTSGSIAVWIDGMCNTASSNGLYWFKRSELDIIRDESEDNKMTGFSKVAIVNLVDDYNKKDYGFALYDEDINEIVKYDANHPLYLIVNARGKDNRVLGILKEIKTVEEYGKGVTAQVVGVVNMNAYNTRIDEENRQKEIAKQKASIEKELRSEIEKMNNIALYEKMAKEHPENPRLAELVNALKELGE